VSNGVLENARISLLAASLLAEQEAREATDQETLNMNIY
jgi:hypothetical protein